MKRLSTYLGVLYVVVLLTGCLCSSALATDSAYPIYLSLTLTTPYVGVGGTASLSLQARDVDYLHSGYLSDLLAFSSSPTVDWGTLYRSVDGWYSQTCTLTCTSPGDVTWSITADDTPGVDNDDPETQAVTVHVVERPVVTITSPAAQTHQAISPQYVPITGTAVSSAYSIQTVEVKIDSGDWQSATYDAGTHIWSYTGWNPAPGQYTVYARAKDEHQIDSDTSRQVTVIQTNVVYVSTSGNDSNDGPTWATAKRTVAAGLGRAAAIGATDVWVAKGTYNERIVLPSATKLCGGFVGNESSADARPPFPRPDDDPNATILDGSRGGNVVTSSNTTNNQFDGFTVTNGDVWGIFSTVSNTTIMNCVIRSNRRAVQIQGGSVRICTICYNGEGVICNSGSPTIEINRIHHNGVSGSTWPYSGVGLRCDGASATVDRNWIEYNNLARTYDGGGIWCNNGPSDIRNNVIRGNAGQNGGGIFCTGSPPAIRNNTIVDNTSGGSLRYGAGICVSMISGPMTIANNVVAYNSASPGGSGYGIYKSGVGGGVTLTRNCSYGNSTGNYGSSPSGLLNSSDDYISNPYLAADGVHLTSASTSCINRANPNHVFGSDIDGDTRPAGAADIGADEYIP